MAKLKWGQAGERRYENGVSRGVLYTPNAQGVYAVGVAWNGLITVTESPSGAESNKQYADNGVYVNLLSAEEFAATVEAFTFPEAFNQHNGLAVPTAGVYIAQQGRKPFGLCYRTEIGNDLDPRVGYKLHLVYGATAAPAESAYSTINDSPEATSMSWEVSTVPVDAGDDLLPTALVVIDSTMVEPADLAAFELILYGADGVDPRLPTPEEVVGMFGTVITEVMPEEPAYNDATDTITIPTVVGVVYKIDDEVVAAGPVVITQDTIVTAEPEAGYSFPAVSDRDWFYNQTP